MKKVLIVCAILFVAMQSFATVKYSIGPTLVSRFNDSRIQGLANSFCLSYNIGEMEAGYFAEQANMTATLETNSANFFFVSESVEGIRIMKPLGETPVKIGVDVATARVTGLAGSIACPAAIFQNIPVADILANVSTESKGKNMTASLQLNVGYRFADINDIATPFAGAGKTLADLNALIVSVAVGMEF